MSLNRGCKENPRKSSLYNIKLFHVYHFRIWTSDSDIHRICLLRLTKQTLFSTRRKQRPVPPPHLAHELSPIGNLSQRLLPRSVPRAEWDRVHPPREMIHGGENLWRHGSRRRCLTNLAPHPLRALLILFPLVWTRMKLHLAR